MPRLPDIQADRDAWDILSRDVRRSRAVRDSGTRPQPARPLVPREPMHLGGPFRRLAG